MPQRQRGQVTWDTAAAAVGLIGGAIGLFTYIAGPAKWSGDMEARIRNVEGAAVRIEGKVDQILLQRREK